MSFGEKVSVLGNNLHIYSCIYASLDWFRSYLSDRTQCARINEHNKVICAINDHNTKGGAAVSVGVPHEPVLGPMLFLIYIIDFEISVRTQNNFIVNYAVGTNTLITDAGCNKLKIRANAAVLKLVEWTNKKIWSLIWKKKTAEFYSLSV